MTAWKNLLGTLQTTFKLGKFAALNAASVVSAQTFSLPNSSGQFVLKNQFGAASLTNNTVATVETVVASWSVPANALAAGDSLNLEAIGQVSSTATLAWKIRMGTTGLITDALLCTFTTSAAGAANAYNHLIALVAILTSTTATANGSTRLAGAEVGMITAAFAAATVNLTVANFITVTLVQSAVQTYTSRAAKLNL